VRHIGLWNARCNDLPPAYLAIAECDILAEQNVAMARKLRAAGVALFPGTCA
jgi:acetyl esterase/lipase